MDNQASREMSALERLAAEQDKREAGMSQPASGSAVYQGAPVPQVEEPLLAHIARLQMKFQSVELEHANVIKELQDRIVRIERCIGL